MRFKQSQIEMILHEYEISRRDLGNVFWRLLERPYRTERGKEFAHQGVARRVKFMYRIIERVFSIAPPSRTKPLSEDEGIDLETNLHAFLMATYGSLDNLAWLWVSEQHLRSKRGEELRRSSVGVRKGHKELRASLPSEILRKLDDWDEWLESLENYRDALAHRIPPYVARLSVLMDDASRYEDLQNFRSIAIINNDTRKIRSIEKEIEEMEIFSPVLQHSWGENAKPILFHRSLIVDSKTVSELINAFLDALDAIER